jgi:hypothetical protein
MANGSMLQELRDVLDSVTPVSNRVATRLTLASVAEILQRMNDTDARQETLHKSITDRLGEVEKLQGDACTERKELREQVDVMLKFTEFLAKNPMVLMSSWMMEHKRAGVVVTVFTLVTIFVWFAHVWADIDFKALFDFAVKIGALLGL